MNEELALRTFAYLKTHYQTNNETLISKEDIEAIDFILNENEQLTNLINEYENKGYDIATERADFLLKIQHLQQELQRKDNEINDLKISIADYQEAVGDYQDELKRKDNIINELKKWLEIKEEKETIGTFSDVLDKIKELENDN